MLTPLVGAAGDVSATPDFLSPLKDSQGKMNKVCFVISPIGDEGSEVRGAADDLFDIVISPVLKAHGFEVIRADKIPGSGIIGDEIVSLIQNATLCVIDLTGHNANVYYECGRRHETGKPYIQLMRKGEKLPFDLAGIRTIFYELSTPRSAHAASEELERFVEEFERSGFANESAGVSLGALATSINRIDRKLDALRDGTLVGTGYTVRNGLPGGLEALLQSPTKALHQAIEAGDLEAISGLFPRLKRLGVHSYEFALAANILASNGDDDGFAGLEEILNASTASDHWKTASGGVARYAKIRGDKKEVLDRLEETLSGITGDVMNLPDPADRAFISNQLGILAENVGELEKSAIYGRRAVDLNPAKIAYRVNLAIALEKFDLAEAARTVDEYMAIPATLTSTFALEEAVDVYVASGRRDDALRVIATLDEYDSAAARKKRLEFEDELN